MTWQRECLFLNTVSFPDTNHDSKAWLRTCDQYEWRTISTEQLWRTRRRWRTSTGAVSWSFWLETRSMMIKKDRRMMRSSTRRLKDETFRWSVGQREGGVRSQDPSPGSHDRQDWGYVCLDPSSSCRTRMLNGIWGSRTKGYSPIAFRMQGTFWTQKELNVKLKDSYSSQACQWGKRIQFTTSKSCRMTTTDSSCSS